MPLLAYNQGNNKTRSSGTCDPNPTSDRHLVLAKERLMFKYLTSPTFANIGCYGLPRSEVR
jgi:hypothetical protein